MILIMRDNIHWLRVISICSHIFMLPMFFIHHRVKLISVFVNGKLHIIAQQRHNTRTPLRFISSSVKTIEEVLQLNLHLRAIALLHLDFERRAFAHYSFSLFLSLCLNKNTWKYKRIKRGIFTRKFCSERSNPDISRSMRFL